MFTVLGKSWCGMYRDTCHHEGCVKEGCETTWTHTPQVGAVSGCSASSLSSSITSGFASRCRGRRKWRIPCPRIYICRVECVATRTGKVSCLDVKMSAGTLLFLDCSSISQKADDAVPENFLRIMNPLANSNQNSMWLLWSNLCVQIEDSVSGNLVLSFFMTSCLKSGTTNAPFPFHPYFNASASADSYQSSVSHFSWRHAYLLHSSFQASRLIIVLITFTSPSRIFAETFLAGLISGFITSVISLLSVTAAKYSPSVSVFPVENFNGQKLSFSGIATSRQLRCFFILYQSLQLSSAVEAQFSHKQYMQPSWPCLFQQKGKYRLSAWIRPSGV